MTPPISAAEFRAIRIRLGYTQAQAGEAAGCTREQVGRIERGEHAPGTIGISLARHEKLVGAEIEQRVA
jgi:DNA-binding XRE family transcriptional regulator